MSDRRPTEEELNEYFTKALTDPEQIARIIDESVTNPDPVVQRLLDELYRIAKEHDLPMDKMITQAVREIGGDPEYIAQQSTKAMRLRDILQDLTSSLAKDSLRPNDLFGIDPDPFAAMVTIISRELIEQSKEADDPADIFRDDQVQAVCATLVVGLSVGAVYARRYDGA